MRAQQELTYIIDHVPQPQPIFQLIQEHSGNDDEEMYGNFNMGAGFAVFMPEKQISRASKIAREKYGWKGEQAGQVVGGERSVIITPKNIVYKKETLGVR